MNEAVKLRSLIESVTSDKNKNNIVLAVERLLQLSQDDVESMLANSGYGELEIESTSPAEFTYSVDKGLSATVGLTYIDRNENEVAEGNAHLRWTGTEFTIDF